MTWQTFWAIGTARSGFSTDSRPEMARIALHHFLRRSHMRGRVCVLLGTVLVSTLFTPGAPSLAGEAEPGGRIVFSRRVSGVVGAANTNSLS